MPALTGEIFMPETPKQLTTATSGGSLTDMGSAATTKQGLTTAYTAIATVGAQIAGLVLSAMAAAYFIRLYNTTHRFSYRRLCYALCVGTIFFGPVACFVAAQTVDHVDASFWIHWWCRIAVYSLLFGTVCMICGLGLGCSNNKGAISEMVSRMLKCRLRDQPTTHD